MRWRTSVISALSALVLFGCSPATGINLGEWQPITQPRDAFFPEKFEKDIWIDMAVFKEPKFHDDEALEGFFERYRLSMSGVSCQEYVIRTDALAGGGTRGWIKQRNKCKRGIKPYEIRRFSLTSEEMKNIKEAAAVAGMWQLYPEFWVSKDEAAVCIDGTQLVFERRDDKGYRMSAANAQCTAPSKVRAVAQKFIDIASAKTAQRLLE